MKVTQMPTAHAANLVANSGNTAYGVDVIETPSQPLLRHRNGHTTFSWASCETDYLN